MTERLDPHRRTVLASAAALAMSAARAPAAAASGPGRMARLTLFDPVDPAARALAAAQAGARAAIEGDRVRLARRLLAEAQPLSLMVVGRHADLLLLADAAREAGYRPVGTDRFAASDGHGSLFVWTARREA